MSLPSFLKTAAIGVTVPGFDEDGNVLDRNGEVVGDAATPPVATESTNGLISAASQAKLNGIEPGAEVNPTGAEIATLYEAQADRNAFTDAQVSKLAGVATGATANATDAALRDRSSHTGAQAISTVAGLQAALDGKAPSTNIQEAALSLDVRTKLNAAGQVATVHGWNSALANPDDEVPRTWRGHVTPTNAVADQDGTQLEMPAQPTGLVLTAGSAQFTVSLDQPVDENDFAAPDEAELLVFILENAIDLDAPYTGAPARTFTMDELTVVGGTASVVIDDLDGNTTPPVNGTQYHVGVAVRAPAISGTYWPVAERTSKLSAQATVTPAAPPPPPVDLTTGLIGWYDFEETAGSTGPYASSHSGGPALTRINDTVTSATNPIAGSRSLRNTASDNVGAQTDVLGTTYNVLHTRHVIELADLNYWSSQRSVLEVYQDDADNTGVQTLLYRVRGEVGTPGDETTFRLLVDHFREIGSGASTPQVVSIPYNISNAGLVINAWLNVTTEGAQTFNLTVDSPGQTRITMPTLTRTGTGTNASGPANQVRFMNYGRTGDNGSAAVDGAAFWNRTPTTDHLDALADPTLTYADL